MRIGLLNLMPNKIRTETQFARLLGATPLQVELTLVKMTNHVARNTPSDHIISFYRDFEDIRAREVRRLHRDRRAGRDHAVRGGDLLERTVRGLRLDAHQRAFDLQHLLGRAGGRASFPRHAEVSACREGVRRLPPPQPRAGLALSARLLRRLLDSGVALDRGAPRGHSASERARGLDGIGRDRTLPAATIPRIARCICSITSSTTRVRSPTSISATSRLASRSRCQRNYFPKNDPTRQPENRWRSHAHLLFGNWINELYQTTPFEVEKIGATPALIGKDAA